MKLPIAIKRDRGAADTVKDHRRRHLLASARGSRKETAHQEEQRQ